MQRSVVLVKPDGLQRGLVGEIIHRFERKGMKLVGLKMVRMTDEVVDEWYAHHRDKDFFADLKGFMQSAPVVAMVWEGVEAVATVRKLCGVTAGRQAEGGSIRGDFAMSTQMNLIHAADSEATAKKELGLLFKDGEIFDYEMCGLPWMYGKQELEKENQADNG